MIDFRGHRFAKDIILICVRWYLAYTLSYRNPQEMMAERSVHGRATEAGGAASHAWAEVYLPEAGWKGFDPTNASVVGPNHIPVAVHRHPEAVPLVAGNFTGPRNISQTLTVAVQINQQPEA